MWPTLANFCTVAGEVDSPKENKTEREREIGGREREREGGREVEIGRESECVRERRCVFVHKLSLTYT